MRLLVVLLMFAAVSCSGPATEPKSPPSTSHDPPKDLSLKFPATGQTKIELVPDHLLGKDFMPGGNLATYRSEAGEYQMFLLEAPDARKAAFMLLDWKTAIPDAKYLPSMGGYYGKDNGRPFYIFAKGTYLAGILGLPEDKADVEARKFAARL